MVNLEIVEAALFMFKIMNETSVIFLYGENVRMELTSIFQNKAEKVLTYLRSHLDHKEPFI